MKVHFKNSRPSHAPSYVDVWCMRAFPKTDKHRYTTDPDSVTCKECLKKLEDRENRRIAINAIK